MKGPAPKGMAPNSTCAIKSQCRNGRRRNGGTITVVPKWQCQDLLIPLIQDKALNKQTKLLLIFPRKNIFNLLCYSHNFWQLCYPNLSFFWVQCQRWYRINIASNICYQMVFFALIDLWPHFDFLVKQLAQRQHMSPADPRQIFHESHSPATFQNLRRHQNVVSASGSTFSEC